MTELQMFANRANAALARMAQDRRAGRAPSKDDVARYDRYARLAVAAHLGDAYTIPWIHVGDGRVPTETAVPAGWARVTA